MATACFAEVSKPNAIPLDLLAPQKAEAPVRFVVKNQTDVRADKKAMIDFSSEFADNGNGESDDLLEEDQSEMALEKEEADYDDEEIQNQSMEDDNDVEDLSGGSSIQPSGDELSFEDDEDASEQTYDDYDPDEDSAADDDNDDADNNASFSEADDEQVMSDVSSINDYMDDDGENFNDEEASEGEEESNAEEEEEESNAEGDESQDESCE